MDETLRNDSQPEPQARTQNESSPELEALKSKINKLEEELRQRDLMIQQLLAQQKEPVPQPEPQKNDFSLDDDFSPLTDSEEKLWKINRALLGKVKELEERISKLTEIEKALQAMAPMVGQLQVEKTVETVRSEAFKRLQIKFGGNIPRFIKEDLESGLQALKMLYQTGQLQDPPNVVGEQLAKAAVERWEAIQREFQTQRPQGEPTPPAGGGESGSGIPELKEKTPEALKEWVKAVIRLKKQGGKT